MSVQSKGSVFSRTSTVTVRSHKSALPSQGALAAGGLFGYSPAQLTPAVSQSPSAEATNPVTGSAAPSTPARVPSAGNQTDSNRKIIEKPSTDKSDVKPEDDKEEKKQ